MPAKLPEGERKIVYSVTISPKDIERLQQVAEKLGVSPVALAREAIVKRIEREEKK